MLLKTMKLMKMSKKEYKNDTEYSVFLMKDQLHRDLHIKTTKIISGKCFQLVVSQNKKVRCVAKDSSPIKRRVISGKSVQSYS